MQILSFQRTRQCKLAMCQFKYLMVFVNADSLNVFFLVLMSIKSQQSTTGQTYTIYMEKWLKIKHVSLP